MHEPVLELFAAEAPAVVLLVLALLEVLAAARELARLAQALAEEVGFPARRALTLLGEPRIFRIFNEAVQQGLEGENPFRKTTFFRAAFTAPSTTTTAHFCRYQSPA